MIVGNKENFAIEYKIASKKEKTTELYMYVDGVNILEFELDGEVHTTTWDIDELVEWLEGFSHRNDETPFPHEVPGETAAEKDVNARDFDSDDEDQYDKYYETLNQWVYDHTWNHASSGGILANVYFRRVEQDVELSWDNDDQAYVSFVSMRGSKMVNAEEFKGIVRTFASAYRTEWNSVR